MIDQGLHQLAQNVDSPVPILFWEPVEFAIAVTLMGFGVISNLWVFGMLGAVGVLWGAKKLRRGAKRGAAQHWIWHNGLLLDSALARLFPAPWQTDYME